ncbi:putative N-acetyltransferase C16C4.12 [Verticillium dahliae VDG1]|nr:putative N-acetyltransferase C16C4.12 [Verticillium dahliae VDG1]
MAERLRFPAADAAKLEAQLPSKQAIALATSESRPFVTLTFATSLDSSLSLAPGTRTRLSGSESKAMTHYLRSRHDAICVGVGTVVADDPALNCRIEGVGLKKQPRPIIIDPSCRWEVSARSKVLEVARAGLGLAPYVITSRWDVDPARRGLLEQHGGKFITVQMDAAGSGRFAWRDILAALHREGLGSVMIEGGGQVINSLLAPTSHDLVDSVIITVLGSLNIDLTSYVPHHPLPGETLTSNAFAVSPGGKGANQAVACAKLSRARDHATNSESTAAIVSMAGAVGDDSHGSLLLSNLAAHGIDTSQITKDTAATGTAIIIVDEPTGQNRIILSPGANHAPAITSLSALPQTTPPDLLVMQLEIPLPTVLAALQTAKTAGVPLDTPEGCNRVAKWFLDQNVKNVIIPLGGRGVFYANATGSHALVPAEKATVVDTTAAGDTFVGSYCVDVVRAAKEGAPFDIEQAIRSANHAAAKTVERKGAQDSIPWRDEVL